MFAQGHDLRHSVRRRCRRRRLRGVAVKQDCRGGLLLRPLLNRITFSTLLRCKISKLHTQLSLESPELKAYIIYSSFLFCRQLNFHCRILFGMATNCWPNFCQVQTASHFVLPSKAPWQTRALGKLLQVPFSPKTRRMNDTAVVASNIDQRLWTI